MENNNNFQESVANTEQQSHNQITNQQIIIQNPKSSALGITSLILSIIGFLTGIIWIGIVLDVIAIIIAIIDLIKIKYSKNKDLFKKGLTVAAIIIATLSIILTFTFYWLINNSNSKNETKSVEENAYTMAIDTFHSNVKLKNEESFKVNTYSIGKNDNYNGNDNLVLYTVTIDYSAQNGFGGYVREDYTVELEYNKETESFTLVKAYD